MRAWKSQGKKDHIGARPDRMQLAAAPPTAVTESEASMHRTVRYALLVVVCLALFAGRAAAQPPPPACVAPTGGDDTALLQGALERCSRATTADCSVVLCSGVFQTGILRVEDFRGTLRGAGPLATTLRALPDLPVNPSSAGFFRDDPFDTTTGAWPYLLQFVEGRATIRDLGILIPDPPDPSRPTSGWFLLESLGPYFELRGAMLITGRNQVEFDVLRVRVEAEPDALSEVETTAFGGVEFAGLLFDDRGLEPFPVMPAGGTFRLADSEILGFAGGSMNSELSQATVTIANNRLPVRRRDRRHRRAPLADLDPVEPVAGEPARRADDPEPRRRPPRKPASSWWTGIRARSRRFSRARATASPSRIRSTPPRSLADQPCRRRATCCRWRMAPARPRAGSPRAGPTSSGW